MCIYKHFTDDDMIKIYLLIYSTCTVHLLNVVVYQREIDFIFPQKPWLWKFGLRGYEESILESRDVSREIETSGRLLRETELTDRI